VKQKQNTMTGSTTVAAGKEEVKPNYELVAMESGEGATSNGSEGHSTKASPDVKWTGLNFTAGKTKILTDCWGSVSYYSRYYWTPTVADVLFCRFSQVKSGEVCAIMGPSGAGKSSLLNVLAGRSSPAPGISIEGKVEVGGKVINPVAFRKNIAYVMQDDALMATATPREALTFSATMRLPSTVPLQKINELVEKLLDELGLTICADVMIGGALIKGISGGQRKRTSVGVELITNPSVSYLFG
jgi:ABC-type lipoprotein export system ATPase subunit